VDGGVGPGQGIIQPAKRQRQLAAKLLIGDVLGVSPEALTALILQ
jgi:hypothetical protein